MAGQERALNVLFRRSGDEKKNSDKPFEKSGGEKHRRRGGEIGIQSSNSQFLAFFYCTVKVQLVILIL